MEGVKAAVYARVSSEDQAERQTIQAQVDFARRWCDLHEIPVADWYLDDGVSGAIPLGERPEGHRLLQDARAGRFTVVLVYRLDRLARSTRYLLDAVDELSRYGVALRSMTEEFNSETPTGRFILTTLASIAELERSTILERMAQGRRRRAREGRWQGGPVPYGYRLDAEGRLVVDDEPLPGLPWSAADVVRLLFAHMAAGGTTVEAAQQMTRLGVPAIVRYMDRQGNVRVRHSSTRWLPSRVRVILTNPVYKGELHQHGVMAECPAIVTAEEWEAANRVMRQNRSMPRHGVRTYLLRGLIRCGLCGGHYVGSSNPARGRPYYVYRCTGQLPSSARKCPAKIVQAPRLEEDIWRQAVAILSGEPPGPDPEAGRPEDDRASRRQVIEDALRRKATERDRVLGLYRRGVIDDATLDRQLAEIQQEEDALRAELARLDGKQPHDSRAILARARAMLDGPLDDEARRRILQLLVDRIIIHTKITELNGRPRKEFRVEVHWRV
ncbi:MAG TPA: recombinase family protein [Thermaerobacter sp.]